MDEWIMTPAAGERRLSFVGDFLRVTLRRGDAGLAAGYQAFVRTNLGRAERLREEIVQSRFQRVPLAGASWQDIPLREGDGEWFLDLALTEVGFFQLKPYVVDAEGRQHWPAGPDAGITVHPDAYRLGNTIYCAFTRMFGPGMNRRITVDPENEARLQALDQEGYAVIPPSGKFRDLISALPHVMDRLGCRILHLLPVNPVPTTFARFGRFGSPYACQDLTAIDPALVEFDKRTTGVQQFEELTTAVHARGGRVFLDLVINHTGWGSTLQENHPEWFHREANGEFASPGAWGTVWEDLVELDQCWPDLWEHLAEVFLVWCRRGVDGFRCDAGYKVPMPVWQYITARVRQEFPNTLFLLEGLGGGWDDTEALLLEGGMQWAYSELFQNYDGHQVAGYLDHANAKSARVGLLVHYSETHDNPRLAEKGRAWSLLRNRLCALTSPSGGFGFTNGVEWLAEERVNVHSRRALAWDNPENIVAELTELNHLLAQHPCFWDGARLERLSEPGAPVYVLRRQARDSAAAVLVLANLQTDREATLVVPKDWRLPQDFVDLLEQAPPEVRQGKKGRGLILRPAAVHCLVLAGEGKPISGQAYREARARAAWGLETLVRQLDLAGLGVLDWRWLGQWVDEGPARFLSVVTGLDRGVPASDVRAVLEGRLSVPGFPSVVEWSIEDARGVTCVPPGHWLLIRDARPFRCSVHPAAGPALYRESFRAGGGHVAAIAPGLDPGMARLSLRFAEDEDEIPAAPLRLLSGQPEPPSGDCLPDAGDAVLLTNGLGGMAQMRIGLGEIRSKYDCVLGANLHPEVPVDRHVLVKRVRAWLNADGFITPLDGDNLASFSPGPPASWDFLVNAGDGRAVPIHLEASMRPGANATRLTFARSAGRPDKGLPLPDRCEARLILRVDLEDRSFHAETQRNDGADHHFQSHTRALDDASGFRFEPAGDRRLVGTVDCGRYHAGPEWSLGIPHPVEGSRGQTGTGDAWSPGWFEVPLVAGDSVTLDLLVEGERPPQKASASQAQEDRADATDFERRLQVAAGQFVVRRDSGWTVIAGYPWFLDWGRDTLIAARGLLAGGWETEVAGLLQVFGRFEEQGTLPNSIHGEDASNRDTSDAPLWYGVVAEDWATLRGESVYETAVDPAGRTVAAVLESIARGYFAGTQNGIRVDSASGLVWSPSHFTWMDTNYPAGTPRQGYPVEIQALWIRLLRQLDRLGMKGPEAGWGALAQRATESFRRFFWLGESGYLADVLLAESGVGARNAVPDHALRSNQLLAVTLGLLAPDTARSVTTAAQRHLVVPGALRSLAPLPVTPPLPIRGPDGALLNDPLHPYWGQYEGDEDTRRKPAYHNGTAWTWTFPSFCEALALAWDLQPEAVQAARAYLGSMDELLWKGCVGQLPEIVDGDAPHWQRGCGAQAWGATEALRVWRFLQRASTGT